MNFIEKSADWAQKCPQAEDSMLTKMIPPDNVRMAALHDVWRNIDFFQDFLVQTEKLGGNCVATGT